MDTVNVNLPPPLRAYVASRIQETGMRDAEQYVVGLIEADRIAREELQELLSEPGNRQRTEAKLEEAVDSPTVPLDMDAIRAEVKQRMGNPADA